MAGCSGHGQSPSTLGSMRSWQYDLAVSCMANSSSVNKVDDARGSSQLNGTGAWTYLRPNSPAHRAEASRLEVCRNSDRCIMEIWTRFRTLRMNEVRSRRSKERYCNEKDGRLCATRKKLDWRFRGNSRLSLLLQFIAEVQMPAMRHGPPGLSPERHFDDPCNAP